VIVGIQAGRMRDRESRAIAREREGAALVSETSTETMAETVLTELVVLLGCPSATLFVADGAAGLHRYRAAPPSDPPDAATAERAEWVFRHDQPLGMPQDTRRAHGLSGQPPLCAHEDVRGIYMPVRSPSGVVGVLSAAPRSSGRPYSAANGFLVAALANLIGAFLERPSWRTVSRPASSRPSTPG
jgi:hypothetical protein